MTSASWAPQGVHRGSDRGSGFFRLSRWGKFFLLKTAKHGERALVDGSLSAAAPDRIPMLPLDRHLGRPALEELFEPLAELGRAHAQSGFLVKLGGLSIGRTKPFDGFAPRAVQRFGVDARSQPAAAVKEVIALIHQHLAEAVLQNFDRAADTGLDHYGEGGVENGIGGDELAPFGPWLVEVGERAKAAGVGLALGAARIFAQRLEAAVQHAAVAQVVEAHRGRGDVGFQRRCAGGPFRVTKAEHLLVVGDAENEVGEAHLLLTIPASARDCGCTWPGCDRPVSMTEGHRLVHWIHNGPGDLPNLTLLCLTGITGWFTKAAGRSCAPMTDACSRFRR